MTADHELANHLLARAGMAMEDVHTAALIDDGRLTMPERIVAVQQAGHAVTALADAAALILQLGAVDL